MNRVPKGNNDLAASIRLSESVSGERRRQAKTRTGLVRRAEGHQIRGIYSPRRLSSRGFMFSPRHSWPLPHVDSSQGCKTAGTARWNAIPLDLVCTHESLAPPPANSMLTKEREACTWGRLCGAGRGRSVRRLAGDKGAWGIAVPPRSPVKPSPTVVMS